MLLISPKKPETHHSAVANKTIPIKTSNICFINLQFLFIPIIINATRIKFVSEICPVLEMYNSLKYIGIIVIISIPKEIMAL